MKDEEIIKNNLCTTCNTGHSIPECNSPEKGIGMVFGIDKNPNATGAESDMVLECPGYKKQDTE